MKLSACFREFVHYTVFSVLGTLGVSCYILADTFFVSKGLGTNGLTALNLAIPVYNFIHGTGLMLGMGGATKFSVYKSQDRNDDVNIIYTNTIFLAILCSIVFMLSGVMCSGQIARLLGADILVWEMTNTYLRWLLIFAPAFILNDVLLCFVRNDESPQLAMTAMLVGSFSNIFLDYIFIFPLQMGIFGAVFATGISPVISIAVISLHWWKRRNTFHFMKTKMYIKIVRDELSLGFPSLVAQVSSGIVMIIFNTIILNLEGNTGVAAYGIIANISLVITAVYTGIAQGIQPMVSRFHGTGDNKHKQSVLRYAMATMLILSVVLYLVIIIFSQPIVNIFNSENNLKLEEIAISGLKLYFLSIPFVGYNTILATFFTSMEQGLPAHILSVLRGLVLIIPLAFVMSALWEMTGVWLSYPVTEALVALLGFILYQAHGAHRSYKKTFRRKRC